jgi:hypothetical protein
MAFGREVNRKPLIGLTMFKRWYDVVAPYGVCDVTLLTNIRKRLNYSGSVQKIIDWES